jgi:hypothetical protein
VVRPEPSADISLLNLALVVLGVDDPDTRCSYGQMVDVGSSAGNLPVMEEDSTITYTLG